MLSVLRNNRLLLLSLLTLGLYFILAVFGFPGSLSDCATGEPCWCEASTGHWVREPWNTWSNLFVFGVCACLERFRMKEAERGAEALYSTQILGVFAYALWIQASGAFYFHGALTEWSRIFDASSVLAIWGVILVSSFIRLGLLSGRFLAPAILLTTLSAFIYRGILEADIKFVGLGSLFLTLALEALLKRRERRVSTFLPWSLSALAISLFFWTTSQPGKILCGVLPGHAIWHIGMGCTVSLFGLHAARQVRANGSGQ